MTKIKLTPFEDVLTDFYGKKGTPKRDEHETQVAEALQAYKIGEAIKKARLSKNLTQEQLGEMIGVKRAQVSRIEKGHNLTFTTIARTFKAMDISVSFNMHGLGKVALW